MAQFEKWFTQDLTQNIEIRHCEQITFTGDNLSNIIGVNLFVDGEPYDGGGNVTATVVLSNGATVALEDGVLDGNQASVTLTSGCFICPGLIGVYIRLTNGDVKTTVLSAVFTVIESETGSAVDPGTIIPSVQDLIDDIADAVATIPPAYSELLATIAPTFSASTAYSGGSYVWYDSVLYRFTADHAAGAWTGTDAVAVVIGDDLSGKAEQTDMGSVMAVTGTVNYGYDTPGNMPSTSTYPYTVNRNGIRVTIDSGGTAVDGRYLRLNSTLSRVSSGGAVASNWTLGGVTLTQDHVYILRMRLISGTVTATGNAPSLYAVNVGTSTDLSISVPKILTNTSGYWSIFKAGNTPVNVVLRNITGNAFSNATYEVTLQDITGEYVEVSGADPVIDAIPSFRYVCTEAYVSTLNFKPCGVGLCSVRFKSGTTPTVLTLPNTVKMPDWWTGTEANRTYEISIADGQFGVVTSWA